MLKNLKSGRYEGIFNYPMKNFEKALDKVEVEVEKEQDSEVNFFYIKNYESFLIICLIFQYHNFKKKQKIYKK